MAKTTATKTPVPEATTAVDDRDLVLCDADGVERTRIAGFRDFRVTHDGITYEHCSTDEAGRWHYRPM